MRYRELPPLAPLVAFEAAARHLSFKRAATELALTPSAISQQIRRLEESVGTPLFQRHTRRIALTDAGRVLVEGVGRALDELAHATRRVKKRPRAVLRLSVIPFMAHELVIPNMPRLRQRLGDVDLRVESTIALAELGVGDVDVAVRFGTGDWPALVSEPLGPCDVAPVCAPGLVRSVLRDPAEALPWLSVAGRTVDTLEFTSGLGIHLDPSDLITFGSYFETIRAAEQGIGIAPAVFPLTSSWVHSGRVALPWPEPRPMPGCFHVVWSDRAGAIEASVAAALREAYAELPPLR